MTTLGLENGKARARLAPGSYEVELFEYFPGFGAWRLGGKSTKMVRAVVVRDCASPLSTRRRRRPRRRACDTPLPEEHR